MKIRFRLVPLCIFAFAALLLAAGCERRDNSLFTAEVDEADYRRGKELLRQGRNQEALAEFQKVIEKRGLNNAPESHLELGLLYQFHIRDPIAAIYHYRRYRELKPTSPQADLVRQRIEAATREFASKLPGQPMDNMERYDMTDVVQRLQRENEQLKAELARARSMIVPKGRADGSAVAAEDNVTESTGPAYASEGSPVSAAPGGDATETAPALPPPSRSAVTTPVQTVPLATAAPAPKPAQAAATTPTRTATTPPAASANAARRHVIAKGDTLYSLAQRYYGNRSRWRDIFEANRDVLRSKDDPLRIGQELKIPQ
ncbi:peptidoglycan-binding protein [Opitutaceae bacterium EW11]|nr:peptidoglycan-binding protein [Opitutaceae bacterium EW11]